MNRERRYVRIMTATYPIPAGVYNQIVTTGDSGTTPANTTLNRNRGNTILVPPSNASGNATVGGSMGIGRYPASRLSVAGGVQLGDDASPCTAAKAGTQRWLAGALEVCDGTIWESFYDQQGERLVFGVGPDRDAFRRRS